MAQTLNLTRDDPVIHLKAYGGVQIRGVNEQAVQCEISAPQLATLVEEDGHVYITVNSSSKITVPAASSIELERGMGSVKIAAIKNKINIEKVLGNLVLFDVGSATIGKVGGNFSVRKAGGPIQIEKVAGNLTVDDVASFTCEKVGGNCYAKDIHGDFRLSKAGGKFKGQSIEGVVRVEKVGGSFVAQNLDLKEDLKVGGTIKLNDCPCSGDLSLRAGGDVEISFSDQLADAAFDIRSGGHKINIKTQEDDLEIGDSSYEYHLGQGGVTIDIAAGGSVSLTDKPALADDVVGDLSDHFTFEESAFSEMIQERVDSATRKAEAKVKAAEFRLDQIRERVEKHRGFNVDVGLDGIDLPDMPPTPDQPVPPIPRPTGAKGATDEERLMILKMLQDNKITVDEAETLFKALED